MFKKIAVLLLTAVLWPTIATATFVLPPNRFPRLANLYWRTPIMDEDVKTLAKWDLVALDMQAQNTSAENIRKLKELNPRIIILAYTSANELPRERLTEIEPAGYGLWHDLVSGVHSMWMLKAADGQNISWWPGNIAMNLDLADERGLTYGDYLSEFYQKRVLATGLWDGLLFDNTWAEVAWVNENMDIDADGLKDSPEKINRLWQSGYQKFFQKLRAAIGDRFLLIGNGNGDYRAYLNGRMFEGFPEFYENGWNGSMNRYLIEENDGQEPRLNIINSDTDSAGTSIEYQKMRFGLTSALLADGYYSFDFGPKLREHLWWYDEYEINLGDPKSAAKNITKESQNFFETGLWRRDFAHGLVLVNSSDTIQNAKLENEYEKIVGRQDKSVNSGARLTQIAVPPADGIILLRPINTITRSVFINGSFARANNQSGRGVRAGFFAYDDRFKGGVKIFQADINHNQTVETVVADESKITVWGETGLEIASFFPYGYNYRQGISMALDDLDGDGRLEIITGSENGGGNVIKIFNWHGREINAGWHAYSEKWVNLGVNVATSDIDGDGQTEIIAGPSRAGGPHIKIFDANGKFKRGFFAGDVNERGGANVAAGDTNGDQKAEIIIGAGQSQFPTVKIFDQNINLIGQWPAYQSDNLDGVKISLSDIDGDGRQEIITQTTKVFTLSLIAPK